MLSKYLASQPILSISYLSHSVSLWVQTCASVLYNSVDQQTGTGTWCNACCIFPPPMCVWVCKHPNVPSCMGRCVQTWCWYQDASISHFHTLIFETECHQNWGHGFIWTFVASESVGSVPLPVAGVQTCATMHNFAWVLGICTQSSYLCSKLYYLWAVTLPLHLCLTLTWLWRAVSTGLVRLTTPVTTLAGQRFHPDVSLRRN